MALQGDDPAVQQFRRGDPLPAEVVDQQAAAVAFHLQGRLGDIASRIVADFECIHRQFAAHDDRRAGILIQRRSLSGLFRISLSGALTAVW